MKRVFVGVLYVVLVLIVLVALATIGTILYHVVWIPLLGVDLADFINMVLMLGGGGLIGHYAAVYTDDFMDWLGS